ncbi:MAG: hypothetical protein PHD15_06020 [Clostridia bacterium]|nr:hypothetical protein [Clostridia bacterium]MDD4387288.1 hypothetical protein [Clostridia bacterium]
MCKKDNLNLQSVEQRREELEMVLKWKIVPKLNIVDKYRVTIAYDINSSNSENIKVLGSYKGIEIPDKILEFFDEFLLDVSSFGLLVVSSTSNDVKNWDISFSKLK